MALNYHALPVEFESVSAITLTPSVDLGTVRVVSGEEYVYVYNDSGATLSVGYGCVMSGNTGFSVTVSSATYFNLPIGVVKHATFTTLAYGWLLTRGFTNVKMHANSSGIVGDPIYLGAAGTAYGITQSNSATTAFSQATSQFGLVPMGVCVQATASAGVAYAYVRCYGS